MDDTSDDTFTIEKDLSFQSIIETTPIHCIEYIHIICNEFINITEILIADESKRL